MFDILLTTYQFIEGLGYDLYTVAGALMHAVSFLSFGISAFNTLKSLIDFPEPLASLMTLTIGLGCVKFLWKG